MKFLPDIAAVQSLHEAGVADIETVGFCLQCVASGIYAQGGAGVFCG